MSDRKSPASSCRKMLSPRGGGAAEEGRETASGAGRPGGPKSGKGRRSGGAAPSAWLQRPPLPQLGPSAGLRICVKTHSGALAARIGGGRDSKNQTRSVRGTVAGAGCSAQSETPSQLPSPPSLVPRPWSSILVHAEAWERILGKEKWWALGEGRVKELEGGARIGSPLEGAQSC